MDVNSMKPLDNLCHPVSVIRDGGGARGGGLRRGARVFHGGRHHLVGGEHDPLRRLKQGDKIILPRNVHRSVINALVLCGGEPVYVYAGDRRARWASRWG